jgi:RNA polymerase sigma factor (sigma-70 family)
MDTLRDERAALERWFLNRDETAFRRIVERHGVMVYAACRRVVRNDADAEDLTQECFAVLLRQKRPPHAPLGPWLHRVATNLALNHLRAQGRRAAREQKFEQANSGDDIDRNEARAQLDEALLRLPDRLRAPLVAHFMEGSSQESIAVALGVSRQTVGYRMSKGLESLRRVLARKGVGVTTAGLGALLGATRADAAPLSVALAERLAALPSKTAALGGVAGATVGYGVLQGAAAALVACAALFGAIHIVNASPPAPARAVNPPVAAPASPKPASPPRQHPPAEQAAAESAPEAKPSAAASISGRVIFPEWKPEDGSVYVGASLVHDNGSDNMAWKELKPGEEYTLENLPPGKYSVSASLRGARGSVERTLHPGETLKGVDIRIVPTKTVICGYAHDPDGRPVAKASVQLSTGVGTLFPCGATVTDQSGYFEFRHVSGDSPLIDNFYTFRVTPPYSIYISKDGYHKRSNNDFFNVQEGERLELDVVLVPGSYSLSGRVVLPNGAPAPDAIIGGGDQTTRSGPDGTFRLGRLYDKCKVAVQFTGDCPYYKAEPKEYEFQGGSDEQGAVFTVWPGGSIVGQIASADGSPFSLEELCAGGWREAKTPVIEKGKRYESGTPFEMVGIPPGQRFVLVNAGDSRAPALAGPFDVKPGERTDAGTVVLGAGGRIVGRLTFPPEWYWGTVSISYEPQLSDESLRHHGTGHGTTALRENGYTFELSGLLPGRGKLHYQGGVDGVTAWGIDREVVVKDGETLHLELPVTPPPGGVYPQKDKTGTGAGVLEGTVLWDNGMPVEGAGVKIRLERSWPRIDYIKTDAQGRFRLAGLDPESVYNVHAECHAGRIKEERNNVRCGSEVRFVFSRAIRVHGRLVMPDGSPQCRAGFAAVTSSPARIGQDQVIDANGEFTIEFYDPLRGTLLVEGPGFAPILATELDLQSGQEVELGTISLDPGLEFAGTATDDEGRPIPYVEVAAEPSSPSVGSERSKQTAIADSRGRFVIQHALEGHHRISATAPGYAQTKEDIDLRANTPLTVTLSKTAEVKAQRTD